MTTVTASRFPRIATLIRAVAAIMLGAAASLKVVALAGAEALLAMLLLSGIRRREVQQIAGVTFAAFAGASAMFALDGSSCGCFGNLPFPSAMLSALSVFVAAGLLLTLPVAVANGHSIAEPIVRLPDG